MRTGLPTFVRICAQLCKLFDRYEMTINVAIDASTLTSENKQKAKDAIVAVDIACSAIRSLALLTEQ